MIPSAGPPGQYQTQTTNNTNPRRLEGHDPFCQKQLWPFDDDGRRRTDDGWPWSQQTNRVNPIEPIESIQSNQSSQSNRTNHVNPIEPIESNQLNQSNQSNRVCFLCSWSSRRFAPPGVKLAVAGDALRLVDVDTGTVERTASPKEGGPRTPVGLNVIGHPAA